MMANTRLLQVGACEEAGVVAGVEVLQAATVVRGRLKGRQEVPLLVKKGYRSRHQGIVA